MNYIHLFNGSTDMGSKDKTSLSTFYMQVYYPKNVQIWWLWLETCFFLWQFLSIRCTFHKVIIIQYNVALMTEYLCKIQMDCIGRFEFGYKEPLWYL